MADNVNVEDSPSAYRVPVATDEIGGVHYPIYKQGFGPLDAVTLVDNDNPLPVRLGAGDLTVDAWGHPVMSQLESIFHGMWTFDIPRSMWLIYHNAVEQDPDGTLAVQSVNGAAWVTTDHATGVDVSLLKSKRHPRYQPNRGHRYSTALWCPNSTNDGVRDWGLFTDDNGVFFRLKADGNLYAVVRSGGVETHEQVIDTSGISGYDVEKGNVYDIVYQWRGVGNYRFYINLQLVYEYSFLGTLTALSMENPALSASYQCTYTTENVDMYIGCVDVSTEGGSNVAREQYGSANGQASGNQTNYPIVSIYNPLTISGAENTRDTRLAKVTASSTAKINVSIWATRDPTALTGAAFAAIGGGSYVEADTAASAMTTSKARLLTKFNVEANAADRAVNPNPNVIDFFVTSGDYIIVSYTGNATVDAVIEWGEEI